MTSEERRRIADCRIAVVGATEFIDSIRTELQQLGFESIQIISRSDKMPMPSNVDVIAENVNDYTYNPAIRLCKWSGGYCSNA